MRAPARGASSAGPDREHGCRQRRRRGLAGRATERWRAAGASAIGGRDRARPASRRGSCLPRRCGGARPRRRGACATCAKGGIPWSDQIAEHHQFSGASLALTAAAYRECGGLPVSAALEDEALERELSNRGIPIHRSRSVRVSTSARTEGRAPRGLAHDLTVSDWRARRSFRAEQFPLERLLAAKRESIAVVLPAREVARVDRPDRAVRRRVAGGRVDRRGARGRLRLARRDRRDRRRRRADASCRRTRSLAECGPAQGKGDAMWRALSDGAKRHRRLPRRRHRGLPSPALCLGLLGPLICEPEIQFVKGCFERPFRDGRGIGRDRPAPARAAASPSCWRGRC